MEPSHSQTQEPQEQQGPSTSSETPAISTTQSGELEMAQESQVPGETSLHHHYHHEHQHRSCDRQHLYPQTQGNIMRTASSASFAPEACHVEDIDAGCENHGSHHASSILHSAVPTPATSRHPSGIGLNMHMVGREVQRIEERNLVDEDRDEEDSGLEMKRSVNGHVAIPTEPSQTHSEESAPQIDNAPIQVHVPTNIQEPPQDPPHGTGSAQINSPKPLPSTFDSKSPQSVSATEATPTGAASLTPGGLQPSALSLSPVSHDEGRASPFENSHARGSAQSPSLSADNATFPSEIVDSTGEENINWEFNDMQALQAHVAGPDPFEQLKKQAPERSSSFPEVSPLRNHTAHEEQVSPTFSQTKPEEAALFGMMEREVEAGVNGLFDSPAVEQGSFFDSQRNHVEEGQNFFDGFNRSDTMDTEMAATGTNQGVTVGMDITGGQSGGNVVVGDEAARFEEGVPLIQPENSVPSDEVTERKEDTASNLFDDVGGDDFFRGLGIKTQEEPEPVFRGLERKPTQVVQNNALGAPPHPAVEGAPASISAAASTALNSSITEEPSETASPFSGPAPDNQGDDFFSQITQQVPDSEKPAPPEPQKEEDDLTARWKAALAGDDSLADDEGFLLSDDDGFLPDSDDEGNKPTPAAKPQPIGGSEGELKGISGVSTGSVAHAPSPSVITTTSRYTPQSALQTPIQQQGAWGPQAQNTPPQPPVSPYAPSQSYQRPVQPPAPASTFLGPLGSPYAAFSGQQPQQQKKAESFVDKKSGYQSPYDLPMDVGPPVVRKRPSNLSQQSTGNVTGMGFLASPPPARSSSVGTPFNPTAPPPGPPKPKPVTQEKFFEELPIAPPKPRPVSKYASVSGPAMTGVPPTGHQKTGTFGRQPPPPRPNSTQGTYQSPRQAFSQPIGMSPQQTFSRPVMQSPRQQFQQPQVLAQSPQQSFAQPSISAPPIPPTTASRYSPAQQKQMFQPPPPQNSYMSPPSTAGTTTGRYSPAPSNVTGGYQVHPSAPPSAQASSYTPAPAQAETMVSGKYAPRVPGPPHVGSRPQSSYAPPPAPAQPQGYSSPPRNTLQQGFMTPQQMSPPHAAEDHGHLPRRFSGEHHAFHSSRPGTSRSISLSTMDIPREEEEDGVLERKQESNGYPPLQPPTSVPPPIAGQGRYNLPPRTSTETPPPPMKAGIVRNTFTPPPPRSQSPRFPTSAATQLPPQSSSIYPARSASPEIFQPPPRAQTQSPGMAYGRPGKMARANRDPYERPSSAFAHSGATKFSPVEQQRRSSLLMQFSPPANEEAARDELKRWQGAPVFHWGFGGNVVTMFPTRTNRYTVDMAGPMTVCSPGEVKVKHIKDVLPLGDVVSKFPGPVWSGSRSGNKGKKKEVVAWMSERIAEMEKIVEECYDLEMRKRAEEKALLWKVVRIMVENDGALEGNSDIEKAVRAVLNPEVAGLENEGHGTFTTVGDMLAMHPANAETVDPQVVKSIRDKLLAGDKTGAIWHAVDKHLWSHAMLISSAAGKDIWKQVVQEFVKSEVKTLGEGMESLAVLYEIFAGNLAESVDELVPQSARLGMPMMSSVAGDKKNVGERLDKWRETLGLVLSNRSMGDVEAIVALGKLLASYGRVEAAHICYLFARQGAHGAAGAICGGPDEPSSDFALLGIDHRNFPLDPARDLDAVMLTEIYELALSLSPHATTPPIFPHLQNCKLHHAIVLAEHGHRTEALKYLDSIGSAIKAYNKPSPYISEQLFRNVDELMKRLHESPKDPGSSWIQKLNSDSVSSSVWGAFNKFVAGEEEESAPATSGKEANLDVGPFAKIASSSPDVSRSQSTVDMYAAYNKSAGYQPSPPANGSAMSKGPAAYQPPAASSGANKYAPRSSYDSQRSPYDNPRSSSESYRPPGTAGSMYGYGGYEPAAPSGNPYEPVNQNVNTYNNSTNNSASPYAPARMSIDASSEAPASAGYETPAATSGYEPTVSTGGYEPPSAAGVGYEPPTSEFTPYQPEPEPEDEKEEKEKEKPKKKGFMDDDEDDDAFVKANLKVKEELKKKEEEEKKAAAPETKKGWFGSWFKKSESSGPKQVKLGEESSFVYDPELKRWVNKKAGTDQPAAAKPPPPPKRASTPVTLSRPVSVAPESSQPAASQPTPPAPSASAPPPMTQRLSTPPVPRATPSPGPRGEGEGPKIGSAPPSRPQTAMSTGDAIDDLLGPPGGGRKGTPAGGRKKGGRSRYVEVIPGQQ